MCGISGYWGKGDEAILNKMIDSLSYRGPDDKGVFVQGEVGLAHRRLSIIDISPSGHQPMFNEDKSICIVFNGEIYNYKELEKKLKNRHVFIGKSDTEIIVHLYEEMGEQVFSHLSGMFAIALFDLKRNKLFLARDRMGKKPLYWSKNNEVFLFGSELKSLIQHPLFKKEINLESLNKYLSYEYVPTPHSIFKDAYKLEPGTYLVYDGKSVNKKFFWKPTFLPKKQSFESNVTDLDNNLANSVKDRLVSDVPIGVFLSGGIDSSLVAYYASKSSSNKIKTFSIGFKEESFDESKYARKVADYLGTEHHEKILSIKDCLDIVPKIGDLLDEPMSDPSIVPTYLLSEFARESVTVALGGDGGDELFCGYDPVLAHKFSSLYGYVPKFIRTKFIIPIVNLLPTSHVNMSFDFKVKKFVSGFEGDERYRNQRWMGSFDHIEKSCLIQPEIWNKIKDKNEYEDIDTYFSKSDSKDGFDNLILESERLYMMDDVLVKVDRASMMNSLEVRAPFLDTRVVDQANHMPTDFKLKGLTRKFILKKLMEGKLPNDIIYRKKKGFGMPIGEWIKYDLKDTIESHLSEASINRMGLFNYKYIRNMLDDHYNGKKDNRKKIWTLFVFVMWWEKWMI